MRYLAGVVMAGLLLLGALLAKRSGFYLQSPVVFEDLVEKLKQEHRASLQKA